MDWGQKNKKFSNLVKDELVFCVLQLLLNWYTRSSPQRNIFSTTSIFSNNKAIAGHGFHFGLIIKKNKKKNEREKKIFTKHC